MRARGYTDVPDVPDVPDGRVSRPDLPAKFSNSPLRAISEAHYTIR
jgi:hypothetical protein